MNPERWALIALSLILAIGYVVGLWINRRKSRTVYRWIRRGLRGVWGQEPQGAWLGSMATGARLQLRGAGPFRQIEVVFLLQMREVLPLWLFNRVRGKGDELVIRGQLRRGVPVEWELRPSAKQPQGLENFRAVAMPAGWTGWQAPPDARPWPSWEAFLERYGPALRGISLRRQQPHLILRGDLGRLMRLAPDSETFFADLRNVFTEPREPADAHAD
ncbi:MAG: hypothetical protein GXO36_01215 [Chloroflexi bacterium]|nr:hypothetical protein [Chloroflexota bacterium]